MFCFLLFNKAHFPNWVRRSRHLMLTKSRQRRKKRRRPELNTRNPKRPFRGSWRTTTRWRPPPDTSKSSSDPAINVLFFSLPLIDLWFPDLSIWLCRWDDWKVIYELCTPSCSYNTVHLNCCDLLVFITLSNRVSCKTTIWWENRLLCNDEKVHLTFWSRI